MKDYEMKPGMMRCKRLRWTFISTGFSVLLVALTASAQESNIYVQCPTATDAAPRGRRDQVRSPGGGRRHGHDGRRRAEAAVHLQLRPAPAPGDRCAPARSTRRVPRLGDGAGHAGRQRAGADDSGGRGRRALPLPHQRRDDDAARSVRPPLHPLARLPAGGRDLRRRPRLLDLDQHGGQPDLLLQRQGRGHLHVPLPRRGRRAHADGHARQPVRAAAAEPLPTGPIYRFAHPHANTAGHAARRPGQLTIVGATSTPTTTATVRRATTWSTRSRSAPSTPTSTTPASTSSRCPSPGCGTATSCSTAAATRTPSSRACSPP